MKKAIHQKEDPQISSATSTVPRCFFKLSKNIRNERFL
jgi:hypothetical protein